MSALDKLPLEGHYGLAILIGEAISDDVSTYEIDRGSRLSRLRVNWQGSDWEVSIRQAPVSDSCPDTERGTNG
jgi:hypothetical protein